MDHSVEKRKGLPKRFFLAGIGCLAIVALVIGGGLYLWREFGKAMESTFNEHVGEEARQMVGVVWGGSLPASASDLHYFSFGGFDGKGYARFSLPAAVWNETFASKPSCAVIPKAEWQTIYNEQIPRDWWTPRVGEPTSLVIDNRCSGQEYRKRDINIDTSNPETYTVYVISG